MATFNYAEIQAVAAELITEFGQAGTVTRIAPPDPVNGGDPVETAYGAVLVPMAYDQRYLDGTTIRAGDVQIYISSVGLPIKPTVGDTVLCGGVEYLVMNADPINFDGVTNVVFVCQGR
ncbi:hypothetical protein [Rhizobium sp. Root1204]|uniref:hypothetical protein n=1 Tax=Rhizobium sp. Root1204 TaxID=1736428 RepID=UPI00071352CE|nr:hypothetical protein [Rhizobium sp. Root1204]KQV31138.1 hypothetical protein ASC96_08075 [Rhizobium sp. Root1204]